MPACLASVEAYTTKPNREYKPQHLYRKRTRTRARAKPMNVKGA